MNVLHKKQKELPQEHREAPVQQNTLCHLKIIKTISIRISIMAT